MESYIAGGVDNILLDELKFTPSPGASYILDKPKFAIFLAVAQFIALQVVKEYVE